MHSVWNFPLINSRSSLVDASASSEDDDEEEESSSEENKLLTSEKLMRKLLYIFTKSTGGLLTHPKQASE